MQKAKGLETPASLPLGAGESSQSSPQTGIGPDLDLQQALHQSIFMPSLASNPTHRLHLFWEQHCRLLPEVSGLTAKQVAKWTVEEVVSFIQRLPGCKEPASVFREEHPRKAGRETRS
ncbi:lethal(3)malignant brain tumor-like protein 1 [Manacus candei]|uniref:lethal(3)malignant brain tumor-like protein 1 n=1 Tax=Manacus candei TaxID=415023 RepID=UPI00222679D4|nr:lethal(3)malignant brain tumor-like protein 1 [Manacus candei]